MARCGMVFARGSSKLRNPLLAGILLAGLVSLAQAQHFTVLHTFTGGNDGRLPESGIALGGSGTIYGTTYHGGTGDYGTAFKMNLHGSNWVFAPIYLFRNQGDGSSPGGGITIGPGGVPYGTTSGLGGSNGNIFALTPQLSPCKSAQCYWNERTTFAFTGLDGTLPLNNVVTFDQAGNIYGTTLYGGLAGKGNIYKLLPSGGSWTVKRVHDFGADQDGALPYSNVVVDQAGNMFATTSMGGTANLGTVVEMMPSGLDWTETVLVNFQNDQNGNTPYNGLIMDSHGNLYGSTSFGGAGGGGTVFELSPSGNGWHFTLLYSFTGLGGPSGGTLTLDAAGNLYGATAQDGAYNLGMVFKLTNNNGSWTLTDLYDFTGGSDGTGPVGSVASDASGNLYGTAAGGGITGGVCGNFGCGTVWEITP